MISIPVWNVVRSGKVISREQDTNAVAKFYVEMLIEFAGEIEADNEEQAEQLAWTNWGDQLDNPISYLSVNEITVEEIEEIEIEEDDEA